MSLLDIFKQIFTSWQVIAITLLVIAYLFLVSHVAKSYHKPRTSKKAKTNLFKKKAKPAAAEPEAAPSGSDSNDELGLEEA